MPSTKGATLAESQGLQQTWLAAPGARAALRLAVPLRLPPHAMLPPPPVETHLSGSCGDLPLTDFCQFYVHIPHSNSYWKDLEISWSPSTADGWATQD
jgi:hypothetical protein